MKEVSFRPPIKRNAVGNKYGLWRQKEQSNEQTHFSWAAVSPEPMKETYGGRAWKAFHIRSGKPDLRSELLDQGKVLYYTVVVQRGTQNDPNRQPLASGDL